MKPPPRLHASLLLLPRLKLRPAGPVGVWSRRRVHSSTAQPAKVVPIYGTGPPPEPPVPTVDPRIARRRRQAELLAQAKEARAAAKGAKSSAGTKKGGLKSRFWKDVSVKEVDGAYEIHLDTRPLRHPTTKTILRLPLSKPHLAHALALEWDALTSAAQATRTHLIPLTSLISRAHDIATDDAAHTPTPPSPLPPVRAAIATTLLRYLDTDSLLCWAPEPTHGPDPGTGGETLRARQQRAAAEVLAHLTAHTWPGLAFAPALPDPASILPAPQAPAVRAVVRGWLAGLTPYELAGVERAALAGKSLLAAARLVGEWSEGPAGVWVSSSASVGGVAGGGEGGGRFGVEEAARAASIEVDWQTGRWGEVEDTHDVEKEDLRRQLGSVVLLVTGTGKTA